MGGAEPQGITRAGQTMLARLMESYIWHLPAGSVLYKEVSHVYLHLYLDQKSRSNSFFFFLKILFIFRERGKEGEREGEKHQCVIASRMPPTGDLTRNPCMCPGRESNQWHFDSHTGTQCTEPHEPGLVFCCLPYIRVS